MTPRLGLETGADVRMTGASSRCFEADPEAARGDVGGRHGLGLGEQVGGRRGPAARHGRDEARPVRRRIGGRLYFVFGIQVGPRRAREAFCRCEQALACSGCPFFVVFVCVCVCVCVCLLPGALDKRTGGGPSRMVGVKRRQRRREDRLLVGGGRRALR